MKLTFKIGAGLLALFALAVSTNGSDEPEILAPSNVVYVENINHNLPAN